MRRLSWSTTRLTEPINNPIGDLFGELDGVDHVGGFLLWLEEGALHTLEGFSYGHSWAENAELRHLYYTHTVRGGSVVEATERDLLEALGSNKGVFSSVWLRYLLSSLPPNCPRPRLSASG